MTVHGWTEGIVRAGSSCEGGRAIFPKRELRPGRSSLFALSREYTFFTPGILYVFGDMTDVPLFEFSREIGHDLPLYFWLSHRPLFNGLELPDRDDDWNRALWAVPSMYWPAYLDFIISSVFVDQARKHSWGVGQQLVGIDDTLALLTQAVNPLRLPSLVVSALGINGANERVAMEQGHGLPSVRRYPPDDKILHKVQNLLTGDGND